MCCQLHPPRPPLLPIVRTPRRTVGWQQSTKPSSTAQTYRRPFKSTSTVTTPRITSSSAAPSPAVDVAEISSEVTTAAPPRLSFSSVGITIHDNPWKMEHFGGVFQPPLRRAAAKAMTRMSEIAVELSLPIGGSGGRRHEAAVTVKCEIGGISGTGSKRTSGTTAMHISCGGDSRDDGRRKGRPYYLRGGVSK